MVDSACEFQLLALLELAPLIIILDCEPGTKNPVRIFFRSDLERTAIFFPSSFHLLD